MPRGKEHLGGKGGPRAEESILWRHGGTEKSRRWRNYAEDAREAKTRDCAGSETQKRAQPQVAHGSGNLRSSSHRERNSPGDGRSCGGETVHGLSGHRADSHAGWVGEQQPWKSSLEQRVLPRVPVHPEAAGKKVKQKKKLKENCGEED